MKRFVVFTSVVVTGIATNVSAERNLIPTLDNQADVCVEQPPEPEWMQNIAVRDSHKRLLVQQIYRAQSMQHIVEAQNCACSTRYPSWEAAETAYFETFGSAEYWDVVEATANYRQRANNLRRNAMQTCEAAGNW